MTSRKVEILQATDLEGMERDDLLVLLSQIGNQIHDIRDERDALYVERDRVLSHLKATMPRRAFARSAANRLGISLNQVYKILKEL